MAQRQFIEFAVPDVKNPVSIETTIENLRKEIKSNCGQILRRAREINSATPRNSAFRLRYWETQVSRIKEAQMATFSLERLGKLKNKCKILLQQIEQFSK
jgi:hypothetical protein